MILVQIGRVEVEISTWIRYCISARDSSLPVRVFNPNPNECVIKGGTFVGYVTSVSNDDVEEKQEGATTPESSSRIPEHLEDLYEWSKQGLNEIHHDKVANLLCEYQDVFSRADTDIGHTNKVQHGINTGDSQPIKERPRRFPPKEQAEIDRQIGQLLENGMIEPSDSPMERVALDIVGPLPETERGNKYILVVGDYFSKWMEAYHIPNQTAVTVAEKLVNEFVCRFGVPSLLHSDQGRNFEAHVFKEMCNIFGIEKTRTTPYNPKSDGLIEKFNNTLITTISMMIEPNKRQRDWDVQVPLALFAYRTAPQETTGETPNMLMLGRELHLPVDLTTVALKEDKDSDPFLETDYAYKLRQRMRAAHQRARNNIAKNTRRQKKTYDMTAESSQLKVGKFVWLHSTARTKGLSPKLERRWEGPFLIVGKLSDVTCRKQRRKNAKKKVVHVDRLKPYLGEPLNAWTEATVDGDAHTPGQECHNLPKEDVESETTKSQTVPAEHIKDGETAIPIPAPRTHLSSKSQVPPTPALQRNPPSVRKPPQRYGSTL